MSEDFDWNIWQTNEVLFGDETKVLDGEYGYNHPNNVLSCYPDSNEKIPKYFTLLKGNILFGFVLFHPCGEWVFQAHDLCPSLRMESIRFIESSIKNAEEIFEKKITEYKGEAVRFMPMPFPCI